MLFAPALSFIAAAVYAYSRSAPDKTLVKKGVMLLGAEYAAVLALYLFLRFCMAGSEGSLPILPVLLTSLLPFAVLLLRQEKRVPERVVRCLRRLSVAALAVLLIETVICNGRSLADKQQFKTYPAESFDYDGNAQEQSVGLVITGDTTITLDDVPDFARCLILPVRQEESENAQPYHVLLDMEDDNFHESYVTVQEKRQIGRTHDCRLSFQPYGQVHSLRIRFTDMHQPVTLESIRAVNCLPFRFQTLRYWVLLGITALVIVSVTFSLWHVRYRRNEPSHLICVGIVIMLCMSMCLPFVRPDGKPYDYDGTPSVNDPYAMVFDAFQKGQVWLDIPADPALESIPNVYDKSLRDLSSAEKIWDYAYFLGKYYCYFGVTPVITYYIPYYKLHHQLPALSMALNWFAIWAVLLLCLTILTVVRRFDRHPNLLLLLLTFPAVTLCCGALYMMDLAGRYQMAMAAGLCFLSLSLLTGMQACQCRRKPLRCILLFVSGASLALCAGARPTIALNAALLIPLFLGILADRRQKLSFRLGQAACFLVPLCAGAGALMWYNQVRFGSPLDFGAAYQFTVSDSHANRFRLTHLWGTLIHYFASAPVCKSLFPFFEPQWRPINNYQHFVYLEGTIGWLYYPLISLGLLCLYPTLRSDRSPVRFSMTRLQRKSFLVLCCVLALLIAWMDFSAGGVNQRYLYDIAPPLLLCCTVAILCTNRQPQKHSYRYTVTCLAAVVTCIMGSLYLLGIQDGNLMRHCPELYNTVEELVVFWQ